MISTDALDDFTPVIVNPLNYVDSIFRKVESPFESSATDWGEESFLHEVAEAVKDRLEPIGNGLVRICGMVTESKGTEFYSGVYQDPDSQAILSGKYRDTAPLDHYDQQSQRVFSREVFVLSEIPGRGSWIKLSNPFLISGRRYVKVVDKQLVPQIGQLVDVIGIQSAESPSIVHQVWSEKFSLFPMLKSVPDLVSVRGDLIQFLAYALGNDYLSAQYILMHMLSRIHCRISEQNLAIGNFPLHIQPLTEEAASIAAERIRDLYSLLVPFTTTFDVSIEALSSYDVINPRMDYESEELASGPLHLAPGTVLILDQSKLEPGKLEQHALRNLKTLQRLASDQMLSFDFMYDVDFEMDIPILVVAKENTTLVPTQYRIGIGGVDPLPDYVDYRIDDGILDIWRQYISAARSATVQLSEEISAKAKQDFLEHKLKSEQMHRVLNLARLLSASYLEPEITDGVWDSAFLLEKERSRNFSTSIP